MAIRSLFGYVRWIHRESLIPIDKTVSNQYLIITISFPDTLKLPGLSSAFIFTLICSSFAESLTMLSQIEISCLSGAIDLLSELTTSFEQSDTYSVPKKGERNDGKNVGPTSTKNWEASGLSLGKQEIQPELYKVFFIRGTGHTTKNDSQNIEINQ